VKQITINDIARISGFSKKTVSRVVNKEKEVKQETREKILQVIDKYDYKPNIFAKNLKQQKSFTLGLIVHHLTNPFIPQLIETIERNITDERYSILFSISDINDQTRRECIRNMIEKGVDGIIMTNVDPSNSVDLAVLKRKKIPHVLVLNRIGAYDGNFVGVDYRYGSEIMMNYLHGLRCRKIAFITGTQGNISSLERLQGYRTFLEEHDIAYDESLVETGTFLYEGGYSAFNKLYSHHSDMDAVFCINDYTALGAIDAARRIGLRVPDEMKIVGFDDMPIAAHSNIKLSTIRIPIQKMARMTIKLLMDQIEDRERTCRQVILKPELVIR
jgi:DNA-binding LacI/PurR family transcriptional regulator